MSLRVGDRIPNFQLPSNDGLKRIFYFELKGGVIILLVARGSAAHIDDCLFATGGKSNLEPNFPNRKTGCASLDLAYVASGRYDGYFQNNLNIWDIAAGIILIKEAGGIINNISLAEIENLKVIASSPNIMAKFGEKLNNF